MDLKYHLEIPKAALSSEAPTARVVIETTIAGVFAASEEAARQMPLSIETAETASTLVRRYYFEWTGGHWRLIEASLNLKKMMKLPPGVSIAPMEDQKIDLASARTGSDSGASCVQAIESL